MQSAIPITNPISKYVSLSRLAATIPQGNCFISTFFPECIKGVGRHQGKQRGVTVGYNFSLS